MDLKIMKDLDPIYYSLTEVDFTIDGKSLNLLNEQFFKITRKLIFFNANIMNNQIQPLKTLIQIINNPSPIGLILKQCDKEGNIISALEFNDFKFTGFKDLYNFDYSKLEIYDIKMVYDFSSVSYYHPQDRLTKLLKLKDKINNTNISKLVNMIDKKWLK